MLNRAILTGRLTNDIELKYTQSGRAVGSFRLAVNRQFKDSNGERQADFISCVVWGKSAESFANYMHKGSLVGIDGKIQTRNYENQQGQKVYITEIIVDNWTFLESKNNDQQNNNQNQGNYNNRESYGNQNDGYGNNQADYSNKSSNNYKPPINNNGAPIEVSDDDLPF